jgi:DNA repair exonuclease SbcCD ATPase subunit
MTMASTGLYKTEVRKARDAVLAQGKHPSVDAVRIALGNTGSKTTIHKYLKELEEEDGGGRQVSISEALQDLVERLAAQLHDEANEQVTALRADHAINAREQAAKLAATHEEILQLRDLVQRTDLQRQQEERAHTVTHEALQEETVRRHTLEQQVADLKERLAENEAHRRSLEDKHQHARESLEHYRQSVKDQRDQDQRRHEQQVQQLQAELRQAQQTVVVKQEEVTRLNQDGVRLVADLAHARRALSEAQESGRRVTHKLEALQAVEQHNGALVAQLADHEVRRQELQQQLLAMLEKEEQRSIQVRELELALAQVQAKFDAQQSIVTELRAYLDIRRDQTVAAKPR